jgi:hypothetical protein
MNTVLALADIGETPVEHLPYSPDFAPRDFWAFLVIECQVQEEEIRML